ncbi:MAG TPA: hypothetical protein VJH97_05210 [Candidatus Nanoarchaeia archaeon]|nr:hypothetical protein [Candidatus Nanoarchaeia archaeon]
MDILKQVKFSQLLSSFHSLKKSVSEWIVAIDTKQYDLQDRVKDLEARLQQLEESHGKRLRW